MKKSECYYCGVKEVVLFPCMLWGGNIIYICRQCFFYRVYPLLIGTDVDVESITDGVFTPKNKDIDHEEV